MGKEMATQTKLEQARLAKHQIITGTKAVKVQKDGRSVEYNQANLYQLESYIQQLESELGSGKLRRPMGVYL